MSALRIEAFVPELHSYVEEGRMNSGEKAGFIIQETKGESNPANCIYVLRCFPRSAMIQRLTPEETVDVIDLGSYMYCLTRIMYAIDELEIVANLKEGQSQVEFPILTTLDEPRMYRFTYEA